MYISFSSTTLGGRQDPLPNSLPSKLFHFNPPHIPALSFDITCVRRLWCGKDELDAWKSEDDVGKKCVRERDMSLGSCGMWRGQCQIHWPSPALERDKGTSSSNIQFHTSVFHTHTHSDTHYWITHTNMHTLKIKYIHTDTHTLRYTH